MKTLLSISFIAISATSLSQSFSYDDLGRLQAISYPNSFKISYSYDENGNKISHSSSGVALPITLVGFEAQKAGGEVLLIWKTANESDTKAFDIEFSVDGIVFHTFNSVKAKGAGRIGNKYEIIHCCPITGINFYRLKIIDNGNKLSYSPVRTVEFKNVEGMKVYPNPLHRNTEITISFTSPLKSPSPLYIYNSNGALVHNSSILKSTGTHKISVSTLANGTYIVIVKSPDAIMSSKINITR